MGRMHNPGKGISQSALPYRRSVPTWLKLTSEEVQEQITRLAKRSPFINHSSVNIRGKGLRPSQIGVILRDSHGVAQVRRVTGNKIVRILKAKGMAPEIPEDLYHLIKKAVNIRKHLERNRKDKDSKYRLILVESRIHRLARYYKTKRQLPATWKYESSTASALLICSLTERELGEDEPIFEWRPNGNYLAVAGQAKALSWDRDGDVLAIVNDKNTAITLWEFASKTVNKLDSGMSGKEKPTFILWSHVSPILAIGYNTGNLLFYNQRTSRKTSAIGKHQSDITCGAFSNNELLALGASDATITVNNMDGDLLHSFLCSMEPSKIKFHDRKQPNDKIANLT
ncbi:40S ribosomal protein S13 [Dirofilaria immitis]|nr:40S ribosomal protein S13 [Dirofilaria immitis]